MVHADDAVTLVTAAWEHGASFLVIPVERLGDDFFRLSSRRRDLSEIRDVRHARSRIVGDISCYLADSSSLRDFVYESNRGDHFWFVRNMEELVACRSEFVSIN